MVGLQGLFNSGVMKRVIKLASMAIVLTPLSAMALVDLVVNHSDTPDPIAAGGVVTYTVRVTNDSFDTDATVVTTTHSVPAGVTYQGFAGVGVSCAGMAIGAAGAGSLSCTLPNLARNGGEVVFTIDLKTTVQGSITLGAVAASVEPDAQSANNTDNESTTVNQGANIALTKTPSLATAPSGSALSYSLSVTNNGPDAATFLRVSDPIPSGFQVTSLPSGCVNSAGTIVCDIAGSVANGATVNIGPISGIISSAGGSTLTNTASVALQAGAPLGTPQDPMTTDNTGIANTTVTAGSDLTISKSRSVGGNFLVGASFNFVLSPSYTGDSPSSLTVTDTVPSNYTIGAVAASQNGWTCGVAGQLVTCTKPAGGVAGFNQSLGGITIPVTVNSAGSNVINSTTISSPGVDPTPGNNTATDGGVNLIDPTVDLGVGKTGPTPALVVAGVPFTFNVNVNNAGTTGYFGDVEVVDTLPIGLTVTAYALNGWVCANPLPVVGPASISCTRTFTVGTPLAAGATSPSVVMTAETAATGIFVNGATVNALTCNLATCNAGDSTTYTVTSGTTANSADIRVLKTVSPATVVAGDVLTYTLEVVNDNPAYPNPSSNVVLSDTLNTLINSNVGPTGEGYIDEVITNGGAATCGTAPSGGGRQLTCNFPTVPVCTQGVDCPKVTIQVRPGGDGGNRANTANVISNGTPDPDHSNETATVNNTVDPRADIVTSKTVTPASVPAGQNLTYVVASSNNGPSRADAVVMTDTLPLDVTFISATPSSGSCATTPGANVTTAAGNRTVSCALGAINNGAQQTVTIIVSPNTVTRGTTLTNNATASTTTTEITGHLPNGSSVDATVTNPSLDLVLNKTESVDPVAVGDNTVYTITVTNSGPSAAENVVITDTLPPAGLSFQSVTNTFGSCPTTPAVNAVGATLICSLGYIASNTVRSITVTMNGVAKGVHNNNASVASNETALGFEAAGNNSVTEATTVRTKVDLEVTSKVATPATVNLRDNFNFVIRVTNKLGLNLAEADNTLVSDTLPAGMELTGTPTVSIPGGSTAAITGNTCTGVAGGTSFSCNLGQFSGNLVTDTAFVDINVPVQLVSVTSMPQTFTNTATISTSSKDMNAANNSNSGNVSVNSSSIAGRVFRDFNNDGTVTAGDTGISGITMTLTGTTFDGTPVTRTVTTDASGNYSFTGVAQGAYTVTEGAVAEAYLTDGIDTAGSQGGTVGADTVTVIALPANTAATGYNFAEIPQARVGIAKRVTAGPTTNADGTFNTTFQLVVENFSLETLNSVVVTDSLTGAAPNFGNFVSGGAGAALTNGDYTIQTAPSGTCGGLNAGFDGSAATTAATIPTVASAATCTINFTVRVRPTTPLPAVGGTCGTGRYCNQAAVNGGTGALSGQTSATNPQLLDLSDNGANPDPDNDNQANEAGENDPTPVSPIFNSAIGISKQLNGNVSVDTDGSLIVPIRLVVKNVGNEPLSAVSVTDPLSAAVSGQFGTFVSGGAAAGSLTSGQYTVQTAPSFSGACINGATVGGFTGHTGNTQLATISAFGTAASCTVDFTYRFKPTAATTYTNQAAANGTGDFTGSTVADTSDNGNNPDPDGDGTADEDGENDPTPVPIPRIGLAKSAGAVTNNGDGTYNVPFTLTVTNAGDLALSSVQITDDLTGSNASGKFGSYTASVVPAAGQYTIVGAPIIASPSNGAALTAVAAGVFTGSGAGSGLLVSATSSLPNVSPGASTAQVQFTVRFYPTTAGPFNNAAVANGSPPGGGTVTDNSVNGAIPDANSNGDPNDDTSPTPVSLAGQNIGLAKTVGAIVQTGVKKFRIPYSIIVANPEPFVTATNVQVTDSLNATFPTAQSIMISTPAAVSLCVGATLNISAAPFTGIGQNNLLAGNQNLPAGARCTITFTTEVDFGTNVLPAAVQNNQAIATTAQSPGGTVIATDLSDDGVTPNANGIPADTDAPTPVSFASGALSAVTGKVYLDVNHDRIDNDGAPATARIQGFIVEVLNATGTVIGSAISDANGNYTVAGLFPSTTANPATYYSVRFREPVSGAIYGLAQSADPTPARNGAISNGVITGLQLAPGVTTLNQNLPLDPSGVVYDAVTRNPVAGATVTLVNGGVAVPAACLVGGLNAQVTGATGQYQFLLINPVPVGCPGNGVYTIQVVQPGGYLPPASTIIPPQAGAFTPGPAPGVDAIQAQAGAPTGVQPTIYFFSFNLDIAGGRGVVNNHIPLDPILGGAIAITKTSPLVNVSRGDLVPYTITATNTLSATLNNIDIRDQVPPGFKYKAGTASIDGVAKEPTVNGRSLNWANQTFAANQKHIIRLMLVVGSGVAEGEYVNTAFALNNVVNARVSNTATATVRVVPDPTFDCSDLIGKVFDDKNANGYQDEGEPGIANVRLATVNGLLVTTDDQGRFHITCAEVPNEFRGSNFVMKLDERTLPSGYRVTTENPRDVRMTRGKLNKLNFGAAIHRVFRIELSNDAFKANESAMADNLAKAVAALPEKLRGQVSVVRLAYSASGEDEKLVRSRLKQVRTTLEKLWKESGCCYALSFEEEIFERKANRQGGVK